ncbi:hypothetical protein JQ628_01910 [Bradyrhizobium lablabi]|uniref:hypothetical protein n=1 Tax=Bradyrhizobium lablabi TaxID=722472 RepID=UPI001BA897D2|nr:hypothetical protein [Bradyrhizobium lablabi]MBR1120253.1 hypothetical protein [Bradyrhizobium lablabi]
MISFLRFAHDLVGKPVPTFPDHAPIPDCHNAVVRARAQTRAARAFAALQRGEAFTGNKKAPADAGAFAGLTDR